MPEDSPRFDRFGGRREFSLCAKRSGKPRLKEYQRLSHTSWDCKYHIVIIPKRRKKRIFGERRRHLGEVFHELAGHKESKIVEGHMMPEHVHMDMNILPNYAVSNVVGYIKGKRATYIARKFAGRKRNFSGEHFWARGYFVSTVGLDEAMVRADIRKQDEEDARYDQLKLGM